MIDKISVIVPVYNVEKYLKKCVNSILEQTYQNIEVILVDDGSTDKSGLLCDEMRETDNRIRVIHKENGGLSSARNAGIEKAEGDYLGFIDSDDYIERDMFETLIKAIKRTEKDIACCGRIVDIFGEYSNVEFALNHETEYSTVEAIREVLLLEKIDVSACDKLYKRELFNQMTYPEGKISEDAAVIFDILEKSNGVVHVGKPFYHYVFRNNSITKARYSSKRHDVIDNLKATKKFIEHYHPNLTDEYNIYCAISVSALLLDMERDPKAKEEYADHYREYRNIFDSSVNTALKSNCINRKMKIRLWSLKTHTVKIFFLMKGAYALLRKTTNVCIRL